MSVLRSLRGGRANPAEDGRASLIVTPIEDGETDARARVASSNGEDGRIGVLLVGCIGIVAAFVLMSAAVTSVAIEDRRLIACADRLATAAAGALDEDAYYVRQTGGLELSGDGARRVAEAGLRSMSDSSCSVGRGVHLDEVVIDSDEVVVTVSAQSELPGLPRVFSGVISPILTRSSSALIR